MKKLPKVGQRINQYVGPGNPNNWKCAGLVRAIVDGHIVVKRWYPRKGYHVWIIIDPWHWQDSDYLYVVGPKTRRPASRSVSPSSR